MLATGAGNTLVSCAGHPSRKFELVLTRLMNQAPRMVHSLRRLMDSNTRYEGRTDEVDWPHRG
jgi:hypothetical protein